MAPGEANGPDDGPGLPESLGRDQRPWWKFWGKKREPVTGRINVGGSNPLGPRWWLWAAGGAVVVGGGVTAAVLLSESGEENPDGPVSGSSYTLSIQTN